MQQKNWIITGVVIAIVGFGVWFYFSNGLSSDQNNSLMSEAPLEQNNLVELPDVVARVNGEEVSRAELELLEAQIAVGQQIELTALDSASPQQLQAQAIETLVSNALIRQAAQASGAVASEADVDAQITTIKGQFADEAQYQAALSAEGITESVLRSQIATDIAVGAYLEQTVDFDSVVVSQEEINAVYQQEAAVTAELPPLAEVRDQIEAFISQQKQRELVAALVQELRADAEVQILL